MLRIFALVILFRKIANVFLALVLLVATTGVTLNKHYCLGRLKAIAVFESANPCKQAGMEEPMPCCEDVSEELKIEEITKVSFDQKFTPNYYQLAVISYVLLDNKIRILEKDKPRYLYYSPPLPDEDIPVLVQSFLI